MKKLFLIIVLTLVFTGCAATGPVYPYTFETAQIEVQHTGTTQGTTTLIIKGDNAFYESHLVTTTEEGEQKMDLITLNKGKWTYAIDLNTMEGRKIKNVVYEGIKDTPPEGKMEYLNRLAINLPPTEQMPEPVDIREFEGNQCDVYEMENEGAVWSICLWNGISLYSTITVTDPPIEDKIEVVKLVLNEEIPESTFEIPEGVEVL